MNRFALPIAGLAVLLGAGLGDAQAVTVERDYLLQPAANCQGALPNYETGLRKTPLAVKNIGTTSLYVTCGFTDISNPTAYGHVYVMASFVNNGSAAQTVNCTLVNGIINANYFPVTYIPKSVVVPAGEINVIEWDATADNGGEFMLPSLSCTVPGGVEVNFLEQTYTEDVGA
jgi:hypothetical protein